VLIRFHALRSAGPRTLLLVGALVTIAILLWTLQLRLVGNTFGLAPSFFVLFAYQDYPGSVWALVILAGALLGYRYLPARSLVQWSGDHPFTISITTGALLALGTLVVYHNHPLAMDEYAAYFQSRAFAAGQLQGKFPAPLLDWLIPRGFQDYFLNVSRVTGSVAEAYWPGFALLLTPFMWAGVPWLCNPVLSALTLLVIYRLALEMFGDREAAGFALLLTIASPVIFANGISYYSMPAHLLANSVFSLLLIRPTPLRAAAAGVVGSLALALHNPVPHMLFAAPWLVWIATRQGGMRVLAALIAGYLPLCALLGLGWFLFSGHLLREGLMSLTLPVAPLHRLRSMLEIFSFPSATVVLARLIGVAKTWVWAVPGLMILAATGAVRWRDDLSCRLFAASALLTVFGYFLVPVDQGHGWGYRYFHSAWMALPLLATAAVFRPARANGEARPSALFEDAETESFVAACILLTFVFGVGFRAWQLQDFMARDISQVPQYKGTEWRVVVLDCRLSFYGADLVQNDPWLRGTEVRMYSHGAAADEQMMLRYFPELHRVYADRYGTVWSKATAQPGSPDATASRTLNDAAAK
jgi:hypothetical protein